MKITKQLLERLEADWRSSDHWTQPAVMAEGHRASIRREVSEELPYSFSIDLWNGGTINQFNSNRCWILASMNPLRQEAMKRLGMKEDENFMLSSGYICFYDQLERCASFLNRITETLGSPFEEIEELLRFPVDDRGQWYRFAAIAETYGVVPLSCMPDTECFKEPKTMNRLLQEYLRRCACILREETSPSEAEQKKQELLSVIYGYLCRFLGEPVKSVGLEYTDCDGKRRKLEGITPLDFFHEYCNGHCEDYIYMINHPSPAWPMLQTYTDRKDLSRGFDTMLNVDIPTMKQLAIRQLQAGEQVVFGADVRQQNDRMLGVMDPELYDFECVLGLPLSMTKEQRIKYHNIQCTHIMSFDGVELDEEGRPLRWKVLNTRGEEFGHKGHYVMSDTWFEEYVLSIVIRKDLAGEDILRAFEKPPVYMSKKARFI